MESVYCQEHKTLDEGTVHHVTVVHMGGELERSGRWLVFLCVVCECVVRVCVGVVCVMCVGVVCVWCVCGVCGVCVCLHVGVFECVCGGEKVLKAIVTLLSV